VKNDAQPLHRAGRTAIVSLAWCTWRRGTAFGRGRAGELAIAGRLTGPMREQTSLLLANCSPVESSGSIREKSAVSCYWEERFASELRSTTIFVAGSRQTSPPASKLDSTITSGNWWTAESGARRQHWKIFSHVPTAP
jgi:hypothetical protein